MSDYSITIVPKQSEFIDHQNKAIEILNWLVRNNIVSNNWSDCVLKKSLIILFCILGLINLKINAQGREQLQVLKKAEVGREYVFGTWTAENQGETHLIYLGQCRTAEGKTYKILTSVWSWGLSKRATNKILIFDQQNRYLGNYKVAMVDDLPFKMEKGKLRFKNTKECNYRSSFSIDLTQGISEKIFIECIKGSGDEYLFDKI